MVTAPLILGGGTQKFQTKIIEGGGRGYLSKKLNLGEGAKFKGGPKILWEAYEPQ